MVLHADIYLFEELGIQRVCEHGLKVLVQDVMKIFQRLAKLFYLLWEVRFPQNKVCGLFLHMRARGGIAVPRLFPHGAQEHGALVYLDTGNKQRTFQLI